MALFENKNQLERKVRQMREWTEEETTFLKNMIKAKRPLSEIAKALNKTDFAVIMRTRYISGFENKNTKGTKPKNFYDDAASIQDIYTERMQRWSDDDNMLLKSMYSAGENIYQLAHHFHRTPLGVLMHLQEIFSKKEQAELFNFAAQLVGRKRVVRTNQEQEAGKETEVSVFVRDESAIKNLSNTVKATLALVDEGLSTKDIARKRKLNSLTIVGHIQQLIEFGIENVDDYVDIDTYNEVIDAGNSVNWETLSQIKELLDDSVSYEQIRYVVADVDRIAKASNNKGEMQNTEIDEESLIPVKWIKQWLNKQNNQMASKIIGQMLVDFQNA